MAFLLIQKEALTFSSIYNIRGMFFEQVQMPYVVYVKHVPIQMNMEIIAGQDIQKR